MSPGRPVLPVGPAGPAGPGSPGGPIGPGGPLPPGNPNKSESQSQIHSPRNLSFQNDLKEHSTKREFEKN